MMNPMSNKADTHNQQGLHLMQTWFDKHGIDYIPSAGNFLTVGFGKNSTQVYQQLLERGTIVRPVGNYGMPEFLRISVGSAPQLEQMFAVLEDIL